MAKKKEYMRINEEEKLEFKDEEMGFSGGEEDPDAAIADDAIADDADLGNRGGEDKIGGHVMSFEEYIDSPEYADGQTDMMSDAPEVDLKDPDAVDEMPDANATGAEDESTLPTDDINADDPEAALEDQEEGEV